MAEAVVTVLLEKLSTLITEEANLLRGVDKEVRLLQNDLQWMRRFIKNADAKRKADSDVNLMVTQIRDITFQAEDVIDEFILKIHQQRRRNLGGFFGSFKICIGSTRQLPLLHDLGNQIKEINTMSERIVANKSKFSIGGDQEEVSSLEEKVKFKRLPIAEEWNVVGIEDSTKQVKSLLIMAGGGDDTRRRRVVVSIVGMGGLGKTTLAKKLYNSIDVKSHFECFAWISVSQEYRLKDLLISIIKCLLTQYSREEIEKLNEDALKNKLREYLQGKRYLIVLDDIWDTEAWDGLNFAFPDHEMNGGSRVLLTTRNKQVALYADPSHNNIHELRFLNEMESWELFLKKIFPLGSGEGSSSSSNSTTNDQESRCPPELVDVGKEMVGKCGGLPLAIVVLGGLLSTKEKTPIIWSKVAASVNWQLSQGAGSNSCSKILASSYYDLPYYLKPCFMHMGLFPEDREIPTSKLFQYWIAEGFVQKRGEQTMEDVAEDYMEELIHRSMIQVGRWRYDGRVKTCRVHDLLRDLAIEESKEDQFFQIYGGIEAGEFSKSNNNVRRLTIHGGRDESDDGEEQFFSQCRVRSLMYFGGFSRKDEQFWMRSIRGVLKLLKVLELCGPLELYSLPQAIGELVHLKYLGLSNRNGSIKLPNSIIKLVNLQTLNIRYFYVYSMPSQISSLRQLRHLHVEDIESRRSIFDKCRILGRSTSHDLEIGNLTNLHTLNIWSYDGKIDVGSVGRLRMLKKLSIGNFVPDHNKEFLDSISKLTGLRSLNLKLKFLGGGFPAGFSCNSTSLTKLYLKGRLSSEFIFPPNLIKLTLKDSKIETVELMVVLAKLPNLKFLDLWNESVTGKEMVFSQGGFLTLQVLSLWYLSELENLVVEEGALISLTHLEIWGCSSIKMLPDGLRQLTTLEELKVVSTPNPILARLAKKEGEDWEKIKHIPSVVIKG